MTMPGYPASPTISRFLDELARQRGSERAGPVPSQPIQPPQGGLLAPTPPFVPPQASADAHEHETGIRGGLLHLLGADRLQPETAALLTPEQRERAKPGLTRSLAGLLVGETPRAIQEQRADQMLARQEQGRAMTQRDAIERQRREILAAMGPMPQDEEGAAAWHRGVERMVTSAPIPDREWASILAPATQGMGQPRANRVVRDVRGPDGQPYIVTYDPDGNEIRRERQYAAPQRVTWRTRPQPDENGFIVQESSDGQVRSTGIRAGANSAGTVAAMMRRENELRESETMMDDLSVAMAEVRDNPSAFSLRNILPSAVVQRNPLRSPEQRERDARSLAALEYVIGALRHQRFGAALTKSEIERAITVFSDKTSTPAAIEQQLRVINEALTRHATRLREQVERPPEAGRPAPSQDTEEVTINGRTFRIPRRR